MWLQIDWIPFPERDWWSFLTFPIEGVVTPEMFYMKFQASETGLPKGLHSILHLFLCLHLGPQVVCEFFQRAVEWSVCHVRRSNTLHLGQSVRMHQRSAKLSELSVLLVFFDSENCCARPNACGRQGWHFLHYFLLSLTVAVCLKCSVRPWAAVRRGPRMERM